MGRLTDKVALVSGVARGQGRSHALRLVSEGVSIIGFDGLCTYDTVPYKQATQEDLDETVRLVEAAGGKIVAGRADVRDREQITAIVDQGLSMFGKIDIVIANAGIGINSLPFWKVSQQEWDDVLAVCLTGVWNTVSAAVPSMIDAGRGGSIVMTSSAAAIKAAPQLAPYIAAKTGVIGMMKSMANDLAPHKIRINCVAPTAVPTDFVLNDRLYQIFCPDKENPTVDDAANVMRKMHPLDEPWIEPADISAAVAYLASDEARYVTGIVLPVDLGLSFAW
ncbi:SDR family mycofactocin-dependent oxidoreductase [Rhodococcus sp. ACS1]|uniref:mycofactocin-coupled SDR family oxidoreductase n=1 Tax=Rhodococcus sp. ACS1 TaxID=2028570 RepID=UPI000BB14301|nr:mycofactocin-coupled SDR family oxidoreductase [Rhodococcus sp. ACS1]PBC52084.1 SDR family mycofactocin-dependent oxidoreductase [Rhodococcus sp. ACS1]